MAKASKSKSNGTVEPLEPATVAAPEPLAAAPAATGTGTSTGTTSLTVASVTGQIIIGSVMTGAGVPGGTTIVSQKSGTTGGAGVYITSGNTTLTSIPITFTPPATASFFPDFVPIIPTSTPPGGVGQIGEAVATPTFPPPTPPPIGTVPTGPLVGPAIATAAVPPSTAGFPLVRYQPPGSATVPAANGYFPQFTTGTAYAGFPNNPPAGVPIVFSNIFTNPTFSGGAWHPVTVPSTPTVAQITLNGASNLTPHASDIRLGHETVAERHDGTVFPGEDTSHLHQSVETKNSRRQRMSEGGSSGRSNHTK